ncbi:MAG: prolyl oligopeptidase family serine peptidase [Bacteroidetes bacterium]|nr:prolyl oligopeptidase family serine peptidase [Bacteroidota bacterium]
MKKNLFIIAALLIITSCNVSYLSYPKFKTQVVTDNYFGTTVSDPYRILENDTSEITITWLKAEQQLTTNYFKGLESIKNEVKERIKQLSNQPEYWLPEAKAGKYFYYYKDTTFKERVFGYSSQPNAKPEVLVDISKLFEDKYFQNAGGLRISDDARYLAFKISRGEEDWNIIHVMDIETKKLLPDLIENVKYSDIAWYGQGFYYSRYDNRADNNAILKNHKVYYHNLGELQWQDKLVYENPKEPLNTFEARVVDSGNYLFIFEENEEGEERILYKNLHIDSTSFVILTGFDKYDYSYSGMLDGKFILRTNKDAPKNKLIAINPENAKPENWETIIPEKDKLLRSINVIGGKIIALYMVDACAEMYVFDKSGLLIHQIPLPSSGWTDACLPDTADSIALITFSSYTYPYVNYKYNIETNKLNIINNEHTDSFNPEQFITKQEFFKSKDGTIVPMFITHKKGIALDGNNPTYIYAYGGFNISQTPQYNVAIIPFLEKGGVYVVVNVRGGGEYGESWHDAGTKLNKQNVFDDFISATEWLINHKYTNPEKIAISGRSNGGLLVGAVITQRPELFKVAIAELGVMDMLRYHKFTIGKSWSGDYGTSDESKEMFEYLLGYSPYHNVKHGIQYPATLIVSGSYDDRVVPAHSYKFAAAMQSSGSKNPVLLYIMDKKGHGAYMPETDRWAFVMKLLDMNN